MPQMVDPETGMIIELPYGNEGQGARQPAQPIPLQNANTGGVQQVAQAPGQGGGQQAAPAAQFGGGGSGGYNPSGPQGMDPLAHQRAVQEDPALFEQAKQGWRQTLEELVGNPHIGQALLSAGATMLQSSGQGQSTGEGLGSGVQAGQQSYLQSLARQRQGEQQALENELAQERLGQGDRRLDLQERGQETETRMAQERLEVEKSAAEINNALTKARTDLTEAKTETVGRTQAGQAPGQVQAAGALADAWMGMGRYSERDQAYAAAVEFLQGTGNMNPQTFKAKVMQEMLGLAQIRMMSGDMSEQEHNDMVGELSGFADTLTESVYGAQPTQGRGQGPAPAQGQSASRQPRDHGTVTSQGELPPPEQRVEGDTVTVRGQQYRWNGQEWQPAGE